MIVSLKAQPKLRELVDNIQVRRRRLPGALFRSPPPLR